MGVFSEVVDICCCGAPMYGPQFKDGPPRLYSPDDPEMPAELAEQLMSEGLSCTTCGLRYYYREAVILQRYSSWRKEVSE